MSTTPTQEQNVAALRFPEFRADSELHSYSHFRFDEIFIFSSGKNIKQNEASPQFQTPCVRYGELYHLYDEVIREVVNKTNLPPNELHFSKGNEILLPSAGEDPMDIGSASALTIENVAIGRTINILSPKNEGVYSQIYAAYYINFALRKKISTLARGSSISNVYNSDLKTLFLGCPSLKEQLKIASFLSSVDRKIVQLGKKKALLELYKWGCMQKLFSGEIRSQNAQGNDFPDWEEKRLGDVAVRRTEKNSDLEHTRVLTNSAVRGIIDQGDYFDHAIANAENLGGYYIVESGDFVYNPRISASAPVGPIKRNDLGIGVMSPLYNVFRFKVKNTAFYEQYFSSSFWYRYMKSVANYGARHDRMAISTKDFMNMPLPHPCPEEQQEIANFLSSIDRKIDLVNIELVHTKAFKKGLLQQMFI